MVKVDGAGSKVALDGSKLRLDLVPPQTVEAIADILGFGAKKYAAHNWMRGISWSQVAAGVKRHLSSFEKGEEMDPETGKPHLAHALCGLTFLHYYAHGPSREVYIELGLDDRMFTEHSE
jgi:hypothetical protein